MPSNNSKYSQEVREETAKFIIESGKSATSVGEEMGIDKNTVCRWVRDYRRKYNLPSYAEEKGISEKKPRDASADAKRIKQLEKDLKKAEKILNSEHYGMEEVKDRVLEFLAVRKRRQDTKGAIICLVGPPGVGKTSVGLSIAKAIGKKCYRFSVGGMKD